MRLLRKRTDLIWTGYALTCEAANGRLLACWHIEQTGAPAFGYPAKDQRTLATECRRLKARLRHINFDTGK
jgi:hypothetical protein